MSMRSLVLATLLGLLACAASGSDAPDFAWGAKSTEAVRASLKQAELKWQEAARVPASPDWLKSKSKSFDEIYLREILTRDGFAYDLLDVGMAKLKRIDECKDLYAKAVSAAGTSAPASAKTFDDAYYLLKGRIRLAIGISRAEISREMMGGDESGYCFQAMEAAIDALRDSALDAEKAPDGAARAERIRKFRTSLFDVWEAAQRTKETKLIGHIDLIKMWDDSGLTKQPDKK